VASGLLSVRRVLGTGGAILAVLLVVAGCEQAGASGQTDPTSRSGCAPGAIALQPRTLAQGLFTGLAWNAGDVVATSLSDVQAFPASGDPPSTLAHMNEAYGLVLAGGAAYFSASVPVGTPNAQGKQSSTTALFSVSFSGGVPTLALDAPVNMDGAVSDGAALYFNGYGGGITRVAISDGTRTDLPLPTVPTGILVHALAMHAGELYVAAQDLTNFSGYILKLPVGGGAATTLASNIGQPTAITAGPSGIYWVEWPLLGQGGDARIVRAGLDGRGATTLLTHGADSIVLDGDTLYIANGGISKVPAGGGAEVTLVPNLKQPGRLAVSNGNAAWVDPVSQALSDPTVPSLATTCW
jgi:hypothetical protein